MTSVDVDRLVVVGREALGVDVGTDTGLHAHLLGDLDHDLGILREEVLRVLAALTELLTLVGEPGADFLTMPISTAMSSSEPSRLMPLPYMMSNSACRKGGATLFLTTFTRVREPTTSAPSLMLSIRRMSRRTDE